MKIRYSHLICMTVVFSGCLAMGLLQAQKSLVLNSVHSLGQGCSTCHVPHGSDSGTVLLWAREFSTQTFGTYSSLTLDGAIAEIGDPTYSSTNPPAGVLVYSVLCMSCHDGVTTGTVISPTSPAAIGNPANSAGLTNDHPVNVEYGADPGLETGSIAPLVLYNNGTFDTVQCATCHNVHDPTLGKFLRITNSGSAICITCHQ